MPWSRLDDELLDHHKIASAGQELGKNGRAIAIGFFAMSLMWSNRHLSDGVLPLSVVEGFGAYVDRPRAVANALRRAGLFDRHRRGYVIHDFAQYNPSAEQIKKRRADRHTRGNGHT